MNKVQNFIAYGAVVNIAAQPFVDVIGTMLSKEKPFQKLPSQLSAGSFRPIHQIWSFDAG